MRFWYVWQPAIVKWRRYEQELQTAPAFGIR